MKILIVENEIYLAQSIASKLMEVGHGCEIATSIKDALKDEKYDSILLSTNISGQNFYPVIEKHRASIIILMISYISNDTVTNPIKAGASDYIQKPFMIEELIRKLQHLSHYKYIKNENAMYKEYLANYFASTNIEPIDKKVKFPILVKTNFQKHADALVFQYAQTQHEAFSFVSLTQANALEKISRTPQEELIYIIDMQNLKKSEKAKVYSIIEGKRAIICSTDIHEEHDITTIELNTDNTLLDQSDILCIDSYIKHVICNFQNNFPDTELSKKLGISRKSLWEKRKKYGINKKK